MKFFASRHCFQRKILNGKNSKTLCLSTERQRVFTFCKYLGKYNCKSEREKEEMKGKISQKDKML